MGDRADMQWIGDPLFKVALPCHMEQVARSPQENDCQMTKVRRKDFLIQIFFRHAIMTFKVVGSSNPVPDPPSSWILCQVLAEFWKLSSCHRCYQVLLVLIQLR